MGNGALKNCRRLRSYVGLGYNCIIDNITVIQMKALTATNKLNDLIQKEAALGAQFVQGKISKQKLDAEKKKIIEESQRIRAHYMAVAA